MKWLAVVLSILPLPVLAFNCSPPWGSLISIDGQEVIPKDPVSDFLEYFGVSGAAPKPVFVGEFFPQVDPFPHIFAEENYWNGLFISDDDTDIIVSREYRYFNGYKFTGTVVTKAGWIDVVEIPLDVTFWFTNDGGGLSAVPLATGQRIIVRGRTEWGTRQSVGGQLCFSETIGDSDLEAVKDRLGPLQPD